MALSPMMQQYLQIKEENKDKIVFFRLGDFYEMFFDDAIFCSRELELTLTGRDCGLEERAPMCGIPHHSSSVYINKLIEKGYKVAIVEQTEEVGASKGIVKREIVRIITPGTIVDTALLDETKNNYIASISNTKSKNYYEISYADITTGECYSSSIDGENSFDKILDELVRIAPAELVINTKNINKENDKKLISKKLNIYISEYSIDESNKREIYNVQTNNEAARILAIYINNTQKLEGSVIDKIVEYRLDSFMRLDISTRNNLEITQSNRDKTKKGSLLWVMDRTTTAMGARNLKKWIEKPLLSKREIDKRLDSTEILKDNIYIRDEIVDSLKKVHDIERIMAKIAKDNANARDLIMLKNSIRNIPSVKNNLSAIVNNRQNDNMSESKSRYLNEIMNNIDTLEDIYNLIENSINEDCPLVIKEGDIIKAGYSEEVDKYRVASTDGKKWLMELETREKGLTGIKSLKVGYNRIFGYYIEITNSFLKHVPEDRFIRRQTLAGAERYITEELKQIEESILGSKDKLVDLEYKIFVDIRKKVAASYERVQGTADSIAILDTLTSFAIVANENGYNKPKIVEDGTMDIKGGRHPVVEKSLKEESFIPNDTILDLDKNRFDIITGPNMSGKSTYMRQVAIITYMAQIGSFVPADEAKICIVDRIFTRVGASDDLAMGSSTFMVEMLELSNILANSTKDSLIILDEIGRGTSTYDGLAIAWGAVEYITNKIGAKTLFATHYHELTELEEKIDGVNNYSVLVKESGDDVIFLRKIVKGPADDSYGIYVAKLAGLPKDMLKRSKEILKQLEDGDINRKVVEKNKDKNMSEILQQDFFNYKYIEVGKILDKLALDELSPKEGLDILYKIKSKFE